MAPTDTVPAGRSLKCSYCIRYWPPRERYLRCPVCREPTGANGATPQTDEAAEADTRHAEFGWYLYDNGIL